MPKSAAELGQLIGFAGLSGLISDIDEPFAEEAPPPDIPQAEAASPPPPEVMEPTPPTIDDTPITEALPIIEVGEPVEPVEEIDIPEPALFVADADRRPETIITAADKPDKPAAPKITVPSPAPTPLPQTLHYTQPAARKSGKRPGDAVPPIVSFALTILGVIVIILLLGDIFFARQQKPLSHFLSLLGSGLQQTPATSTAPASLDLNEEKPPIGKNLMLSNAQVRYCLAEKQRIGAIENLLNQHSQEEINAYNAWVTDFNLRCATFRYDKTVYDTLKHQVEEDQNALVEQAKQRLTKLHEDNAAAKPN
jgi:hypothetical protein